MNFNAVGPAYFETMGTPLVVGRDFNERDVANAAPAAIVNEAFVRKFFPEGHPLGQQVSTPNPRLPAFQIVGVVKDTVSATLRVTEPPPFLCLPYFQLQPDSVSVATYEVRVDGSLARTEALLRDVLRDKFHNAPVNVRIEGLTAQVRRALNQERMLAALGAGFGILALVLSAVGLYGLLAYTVARSTNEIGIRMALGAQRATVLSLIFGNALRLLGLGIAIGIPSAWMATRLISSLLFGMKGTDPLTTVGAVLLLGAAALLAALLPAMRASRVDPMMALRHE